jgi:hypothetical protein
MGSFRVPEVETVSMTHVRYYVGTGLCGDPFRYVDSYYRDDVHVFTVDDWMTEREAG